MAVSGSKIKSNGIFGKYWPGSTCMPTFSVLDPIVADILRDGGPPPPYSYVSKTPMPNYREKRLLAKIFKLNLFFKIILNHIQYFSFYNPQAYSM